MLANAKKHKQTDFTEKCIAYRKMKDAIGSWRP